MYKNNALQEACLLLILIVGARCASLSITLDTTTINADSPYRFMIVDDNLKTFDGTIRLTFPSADYSISTLSVYNANDQSQVYAHTLTSSSIVQFTYTRGSFPGKVINVVLDEIKNPSSQKTVIISYDFFSGSTTYSSTSESFNGFDPDTLTSCSLTFLPSVTHTESVATLSVTVKNAVQANGAVTITYPESWANPASASYPPVFLSSTICSKISGSSLASSITCTILDNQISTGSIFSTEIAADSSFSFSMTGIRTPPTTSSANLITVTTQTSSGNLVDTIQTCSVTAVSAQTISLSTTSSFVLGVAAQLDYSWVTESPLKVGDSFILTLPSSYMNFQSVANTFIEADSTIVYFSTALVTNNQYRFTISSIQGGSTQISSGVTISFTGIYVKCLVDTSARSISVQITRNSLSVASGTMEITPTANTLTSVTISSDVDIVSTPMTMTIDFTLANSLSTSGYITVQLPATIQLTGSSPICTVTSSNHASSLLSTSSCSLSSQILTVSSFLSTDLTTLTLLSLQIEDALVNPLTSQPTSVFIISTYSSADSMIDSSSTVTYEASAGTIGSISFTPTDTIVASENVYTMLYTMTRTIKSGSTLTITIPPELSLSSSPSYQYSINSAAYSSITPSLEIVDSSTQLTFTGMFGSDLIADDTIQIKFTNIRNPLSLSPSSSFIAQTAHSGYTIQSLSAGKTITNTQMNQFIEIIPIVSTPTNGQTKTYNFYIKPSVALQTDDKITIELVDNTAGANQLTFSSTVTGCRIFYSSVTVENTCSVVGSILTVTLTGPLSDTSGATQYQLIVESIVLARTMEDSSLIKITSYSSDGFGISQNTVSSVVNTEPNQISDLQLTILDSPSLLNQVQQFRLAITTFNGLYLNSGDYIVVTVPQSYSFVGDPANLPANLCTNTNLTCSLLDSADYHSIKIQPSASFTSTSLTNSFTITVADNLYQSPKTFSYSTDYFYVTTYTSSEKVIDQTVGLTVTFQRTCGGFCQTCLSSNTSSCLSCYDPINDTVNFDGYNYLTSDNNCVDQCGDTYYNNSGICTPCDDPCYGCSSSATDCTSCVDGFFYDSTQTTDKCVSVCSDGYYGDQTTNICKTCSSQCQTCEGTSIFCTSCQNGTYLYNGQCKTVCPEGYENSAINQCSDCDISCDGCLTTATECEACTDGYYVSGDECVTDCPSGTAPNTVTDVCQCSDSCLTCEGSLTYCLSCANSSYVLYENSCLDECPSTTYLPAGDTECEECPFSNCIYCTVSECTTCEASYFEHLGGCVSECPDGYYETSNYCESCGSGCLSCEVNTQCLSCSTGYLKEASACVLSCSSGYINFNATVCLTTCPDGYYNNSGTCSQEDTTTPTTTTTTPEEEEASNKMIPFPYTIAYILMLGLCIGMKCIHPYTLLASAVMSFGSILEIFSAITFIIFAYVQLEEMARGAIVAAAVIALTYICNIISLIFICKILHNDTRFMLTYKKTVCANVMIRIISLICSHKFHEIVFSNIFASRPFCNKVEYVSKLKPFNVLLILSILLSFVFIGGAGALSYSLQDQNLTSATFIWSLDSIFVWVFNVIATILVLRRKDTDYDRDVVDEEARRYETQDQLNFNNQSSAMDQVFIEESRVNPNHSRMGQSRKQYFYHNSRKSGAALDDPYETPLDKKLTNKKNPIKSGNIDPEESSQALRIDDKNKKKIEEDSNEDIEEIMLEEPVRQNLTNINKPGNHDSPIKDSAYTGSPTNKLAYEGQDLDPQLLVLSENSKQFKKLPAETKAKIRLAKANRQINQNGKNVSGKKKQGNQNNETIPDPDIAVIQLSAKKDKKAEGDGFSSGEEDHKKDRKSLNKSKSKEKNRNESPKHGDIARNLDLNVIAVQKEESPDNRMNRNRSEQMKKNKKNLKKDDNKGTKSQNLKKNKKKINAEEDGVQVVYAKNKSNPDQIENADSQENSSLGSQEQEDEPKLPVFIHNGKNSKRYGTDSDGFEAADEKYEKGKKNFRQSENKTDLENRSKLKHPNSSMKEQKADDFPELNSQKFDGLIIQRNNQSKLTGEQGFSNDDESIYKKIYNDDAETLKSVQGDNFFGNDISPSQFNIQNQRFEDTDYSNDMPVKPVLMQFEGDGPQVDDGFDHEPEMKRYSSYKQNFNIDYDLVREKRQQNDRIKDLEKIYLPRLQVKQPKRKKDSRVA